MNHERGQDISRASGTQDDVKRQVRELFRKVKQEHRETVLKALETYPDNSRKISYLRGWLFIERGIDNERIRRKSAEVSKEPRQ